MAQFCFQLRRSDKAVGDALLNVLCTVKHILPNHEAVERFGLLSQELYILNNLTVKEKQIQLSGEIHTAKNTLYFRLYILCVPCVQKKRRQSGAMI